MKNAENTAIAPSTTITGTDLAFIGEPAHTQFGWYAEAHHPEFEETIFILWKKAEKPTLENLQNMKLHLCQERRSGRLVYGCTAA